MFKPIMTSTDVVAFYKELDNLGKRYDEGKKVVATMRIVKFFVDENKNEVIKLDPQSRTVLERIQKEYNTGADWVGVLMAVYNGFAANGIPDNLDGKINQPQNGSCNQSRYRWAKPGFFLYYP